SRWTTPPWRRSSSRTAGSDQSQRAFRRSRGALQKSTSTGRAGRRSASKPTAGRHSLPACPGSTQPPSNTPWPYPAREGRLAESQAEDRARFAAVDGTSHYHALQFADFFAAIRERRRPLVTGEDGRAVVELFAAIYRSSREGKPVALRG